MKERNKNENKSVERNKRSRHNKRGIVEENEKISVEERETVNGGKGRNR